MSGIDDGATVSSGGDQVVTSDGLAVSATVDGEQDVYGSSDFTTIGAGGTEQLYGTDYNTTVDAGGYQTVESGGSAVGAVVSGGEQDVYGAAQLTTIDSGGTEVVLSGGTDNGATIEFGGTELVSVGGVANDALLEGGEQDVYGSAGGSIIDNGGAEYVYGIDSGATIDSGGYQKIEIGGSALGVNVGDGVEDVFGTASGTVIADNGTEYLYGTDTGTVAEVNGYEVVAYGGTAFDTVLSGGEQDVYGAASGVTIDNGGFEYLIGFTYAGGTASGTATGVVISSGGAMALAGGGDSGTIIESGGTEFVNSGGVASDVQIDGGTLDVQSGGVVSGTITFTGAGGTLQIDGPNALGDLIPGATIYGLSAGDVIDLTGIAYDPSNSVGVISADGQNGLQIDEGGTTYDLTLDPGASFSGFYFHLNADGAGTGTAVTEDTTPCYCRGTLIATRRGQKPVEMLKIGDRVMTMSGVARSIRWIGRRSYGGRFIIGRADILPVCIKAGALADGVPRRDLWISPNHAMYLDGLLIEAKDLVNGESIVQAAHAEQVDYFHIELATHDVIIAEGALSETFVDDDNRGLFHNAQEHRTLYPDSARAAPQYCAPRPAQGYAVEQVCRRIAQRAANGVGAEAHALPLRGYVDVIGARRIAGWAQNPDHPEAPVCLDIHVGGQLIGRALANQYRDDLARAGVGSGRHAFEFILPAGLVFERNSVEVRRSLDGARLQLSHPFCRQRNATIRGIARLLRER